MGDERKPRLSVVGLSRKDAKDVKEPKLSQEEKLEENALVYGQGLSEGYAKAIEILIKYEYQLRLAGLKCSQAKTQKEVEYSVGFIVGFEQALTQFGVQDDD